jgi:hypothetical protein
MGAKTGEENALAIAAIPQRIGGIPLPTEGQLRAE